jgi:hypothetical protein
VVSSTVWTVETKPQDVRGAIPILVWPRLVDKIKAEVPVAASPITTIQRMLPETENCLPETIPLIGAFLRNPRHMLFYIIDWFLGDERDETRYVV